MTTTPCVQSTAKPSTFTGYARRKVNGQVRYDHHLAYEQAHGPIPEGMVLDHTCHDPETCPNPGPKCLHRSCVNADHLTPVPRSRNSDRERAWSAHAAKTECPKGHAYDEENTYVDPRGRRHCRTCTAASRATHAARKREGAGRGH